MMRQLRGGGHWNIAAKCKLTAQEAIEKPTHICEVYGSGLVGPIGGMEGLLELR